jgi:hypothetical protein
VFGHDDVGKVIGGGTGHYLGGAVGGVAGSTVGIVQGVQVGLDAGTDVDKIAHEVVKHMPAEEEEVEQENLAVPYGSDGEGLKKNDDDEKDNKVRSPPNTNALTLTLTL